MNRQLIRGSPRPAGAALDTARRAVSITSAWKSGKRSQVIAVSKVSESTPQAISESRRYGACRNALRQVLTASLARRSPPPLISPGSPPCARATSSTIDIGSSTGWCADSTPSTRSALPGGPAEVVADSTASSRRQFDGLTPDWAISRTASAPAAKSSKPTPAESLWVGRSRTRTQASVITPRIPSEPISIRSGLGPAPDPGSRRLSQSPPSVTARIDSTRSSMCV